MAIHDPQQPAPQAFGAEDLRSIQGIGVAGFKKDHQELMFLTFGGGQAAKALVTVNVKQKRTHRDSQKEDHLGC